MVFKALTRLEYRGYDSAGLATISRGHLWHKKGVGKLPEVQAQLNLDKMPGTVGIGHVRWATHGAVTDANAHPHLDCRGRIAVVHNGIIENYQELRASLSPTHRFLSETDSEVIPHLIEAHMAQGMSLEDACYHTSRQLKGSYAFLAIAASEPDKIVACRQDSPLVVGHSQGRCFIASDVPSFLEHTNQVTYMEDGEMVVLVPGQATFYNGLKGDLREPLAKEVSQIDWTLEDISKQGYDYFMLKEIMEEPTTIRRALEQDRQLVMDAAMDILRARQVVITACGTSRYAALIGRYLFSKLAGKFCDVVMASEFQYFSDSVDKNTLVIAVSQSGETADVMEGVRRAKANEAQVLSIVNTQGSSVARASDRVIYLDCGPEMAVAATKSFVSQLAVFYLLAYAMRSRLDEGIAKLKAAAGAIERELKDNFKKVERLAEVTKDRADYYFIARGANFAIATEGALKLKEISYIHAEGMPAGELKHGTLSLIEDGTPVVVICPQDYTHAETLSNAMEARARGAYIIGVSDADHEAFHEWIRIPQTEEVFYPLVTVIPLQLLAYYLALARGLDPDHPRHLAKSVTVK
ncbi:MAG: glutamine--fructose-6-phosphate transaminase (isomerizing) [Chloroflexi bacterium]|nr:glutamine--fructose-6-phosphate transaminase (isomerizing) [Chloroflexota bacterium]